MFFHRFSHNFCSVGGKFLTLRSYVSKFFLDFSSLLTKEIFPEMNEEGKLEGTGCQGDRK